MLWVINAAVLLVACTLGAVVMQLSDSYWLGLAVAMPITVAHWWFVLPRVRSRLQARQ